MIRIYHPTNRNNNRIKEIDFLRGFLILLMVMDHLFFDFGQLIYIISNFSMDQSLLSQFVKLSSSYLSWDFRINFRIFVVMLFFFISGISFQFSKNNFNFKKRKKQSNPKETSPTTIQNTLIG